MAGHSGSLPGSALNYLQSLQCFVCLFFAGLWWQMLLPMQSFKALRLGDLQSSNYYYAAHVFVATVCY